MNIADLLTLARQQYNAVNDTFFSDSELYNLVWRAEEYMAMETLCIKQVQSTTSVAGQREYAKPTNCIAVKRITHDGRMLQHIDFMDDDLLTAYNEATTNTGTPLHFSEWGSSLYLRPVPATGSTGTLKVYFYAKPSQVTATTTLEVPDEYHKYMVDFLLYHMFSKDGKDQLSAYHLKNWQESVELIKGWEKRRLRQSGTQFVKNEDVLTDLLGTVISGAL